MLLSVEASFGDKVCHFFVQALKPKTAGNGLWREVGDQVANSHCHQRSVRMRPGQRMQHRLLFFPNCRWQTDSISPRPVADS